VIHEIDQVPDKKEQEKGKAPAQDQEEDILGSVFLLILFQPVEMLQQPHIDKGRNNGKHEGHQQELRHLPVEAPLEYVEPDDGKTHRMGSQKADKNKYGKPSEEDLDVHPVLKLVEGPGKKGIDQGEAPPSSSLEDPIPRKFAQVHNKQIYNKIYLLRG
jgi:hypothetical protein